MTGAAAPSGEELREALVEALRDPLRDLGMGQYGPGPANETIADALLPVVRRYADQRAAEELRVAAKNVSWPTVNATFFRRVLRGRAEALAREATT